MYIYTKYSAVYAPINICISPCIYSLQRLRRQLRSNFKENMLLVLAFAE